MNQGKDYSGQEAQAAWRAFEHSGKVMDYLSYIQCVHVTGNAETADEPPEDGKHAGENKGPGSQAAEYR